MLQDTKYGTIAGGTMAGLNIMAMGAAYVPDKNTETLENKSLYTEEGRL